MMLALNDLDGSLSLASSLDECSARQDSEKDKVVDIVKLRKSLPTICRCESPKECLTIQAIMETLGVSLDEETAWAMLYQILILLKSYGNGKRSFSHFEVPESMENVCLHRDGSIHWNWPDEHLREFSRAPCDDMSDAAAMQKVGVIVYSAMDYLVSMEDERELSEKMETALEFICFGNIDSEEEFKSTDSSLYEYALSLCRNRVNYTTPEAHYTMMITSLYRDAFNVKHNRLEEIETQYKEKEDGSGDAEDSESREFGGVHVNSVSETKKQKKFVHYPNSKDWNKAYNEVVDELKNQFQRFLEKDPSHGCQSL